MYTDTAHTSQSSTITMWPAKNGPTRFTDGEEGWGESQEIAAARDVGGDKSRARLFFFFHGASTKKRGGFFFGTNMLQLRLASILAMRGGDAQSTSEDDAGEPARFSLVFRFFLHSRLHTCSRRRIFLCPCVVPLMRARVCCVVCRVSVRSLARVLSKWPSLYADWWPPSGTFPSNNSSLSFQEEAP